jgi:hypothetical protein
MFCGAHGCPYCLIGHFWHCDDATKMVPCIFFPFSMCLSFITINHLPAVRVYCTLIPSVSCHCGQFLCFLSFAVCTFFILSFNDQSQLTRSIYFLIQQAQSLHHSNFLLKKICWHEWCCSQGWHQMVLQELWWMNSAHILEQWGPPLSILSLFEELLRETD